MMEANKRVGRIELLEEQIEKFNQENKTSYWTKLIKLCENLSSDQQEFLNNSENVISAKTLMAEAFNLFLFESFKEQFAQSEKYNIFCDKYISSIEDALKDYSGNVQRMKQEIENLKMQLKEKDNNRKGGYCED